MDIKNILKRQTKGKLNICYNLKRFPRLTKILINTSKYKNVGYIQGMNYIAAALLFHSNEDDSVFVIK